ncbi:MAG: hypothetical protein ACYTHM_18465 [Planctomycetota bacterium]
MNPLDFCVNRIMALQELQALGRMAAGFERTGCYACSGLEQECDFYTPIGWVYEKEEEIPGNIAVFIALKPASETEPTPGK